MKTSMLRMLVLATASAFVIGCGGGTEAPGGTPATSAAKTAPASTTSTSAPAASVGSTDPLGASAPAGATVGDAPTPAAVAASAIDPAARAEADKIFTERCVTCHGASGHGDGPAAAVLDPKPRNYSLPEWQSSVTDEQIAHIIVQGGQASGKSMLMPPSPDLASKPDVVKALVAKIRAFKAQ